MGCRHFQWQIDNWGCYCIFQDSSGGLLSFCLSLHHSAFEVWDEQYADRVRDEAEHIATNDAQALHKQTECKTHQEKVDVTCLAIFLKSSDRVALDAHSWGPNGLQGPYLRATEMIRSTSRVSSHVWRTWILWWKTKKVWWRPVHLPCRMMDGMSPDSRVCYRMGWFCIVSYESLVHSKVNSFGSRSIVYKQQGKWETAQTFVNLAISYIPKSIVFGRKSTQNSMAFWKLPLVGCMSLLRKSMHIREGCASFAAGYSRVGSIDWLGLDLPPWV